MAGHGPAPKAPEDRIRRNKVAPMTVLTDDGEVRGPELPDTYSWPKATLDWWETWRRSPQAQGFTETDWSFLLDTAMLHADYWLGDRTVAAELRLRAAKFGATPEDRMRLKLEIGDPGKTLPPRLPARQRRERLLKAVGDAAEQ